MKYNPKPFERSLTRFIARQAALIDKLLDEAVKQSVLETERFGVKADGEGDFFFKDYPGLSRKVDGILKTVTSQITKSVTSGIEWGWDLANAKDDDLVWKVINSIGSTRVPYYAPARWMQKNLPALEAFEERRVGGMNLSDRVWKYTSGMKGDLELALDLGIGEGMSADRLSREVRRYLREPDRLYRRVRDEKGVLRLSKSASNYHPGQGVYRSAYKNAKRLTATETNMAYRSADYERNQQLDFVLGIEVHLSNNHTCLNAKGEPEPFYDICDELKGIYPAWFKFTGWHPLCRCYTTTVLPSQEEMIEYLAAMDENGNSTYQFSGRVEEMPKQFNKWLDNNADRIESAEERGKLPYFLKDNPSAWKDVPRNETTEEIISNRTLTEEERTNILARAKARHEARTLADIRATQDRWDERVYGKEYVDNVHELEKSLGILRGKRMTHEEANTGNVNPFWYKRGYMDNCSTCSGVYVLRRMGFDVYAKPKWGDNTVAWLSRGEATWAKWIDGKTTYTKSYDWMTSQGLAKMTENDWKRFLEEKTKAVGIYEFNVGWGPKNGHSTLLERTADGVLRRIEQQWKGCSEDIDVLIKQLYGIPNKSTRGIMRVDNARFHPSFCDIAKVNKKSKGKR